MSEKFGKDWQPERCLKIQQQHISCVLWIWYCFLSLRSEHHKPSSVCPCRTSVAPEFRRQTTTSCMALQIPPQRCFFEGGNLCETSLKVSVGAAQSLMIYFALGEAHMWIRGWCSEVQSRLRCCLIISMQSASWPIPAFNFSFQSVCRVARVEYFIFVGW